MGGGKEWRGSRGSAINSPKRSQQMMPAIACIIHNSIRRSLAGKVVEKKGRMLAARETSQHCAHKESAAPPSPTPALARALAGLHHHIWPIKI